MDLPFEKSLDSIKNKREVKISKIETIAKAAIFFVIYGKISSKELFILNFKAQLSAKFCSAQQTIRNTRKMYSEKNLWP